MKRILIVEDTMDWGRVLQEALKLAYPDARVTVVPSGEEALLESTRLALDLLVTDVRLPGMSGLDLVRKIRLRQPQVKVIVMTGLVMDEPLKRQKEEIQADAFLHKPLSVSTFLDVVDGILGAAVAVEQAVAPSLPPLAVAREPDRDASRWPERAAAAMARSAANEPAGNHQQPAHPEPAPAQEGLAELLPRLRGSLGAIAAVLLDDRGHPVAQAGDLPDLHREEQLALPVLAALSAGARVSYLLHPTAGAPQFAQAYRGSLYDLVAAPVGQYTLILALPKGRSTLRLALAIEEVLDAQVECVQVLQNMGLRVQPAAGVGAPEALLEELQEEQAAEDPSMPAEPLVASLVPDPSLIQLAELFAGDPTHQLPPQDLNAFWDTAAGEEPGGEPAAGVLSFEQAQKLGLLPARPGD